MKRPWRRCLSCVLALCVLLPPAALTASAASAEPLVVNVITDVHFRPLWAVPDVGAIVNMPGSELYAHAAYNAQLYPESEAVLAEFFKGAAASASSAVLVAGDMVDGANRAYHSAFAQRLAAFENSTGKRVFVINGNNDISPGSPGCASPEDFAAIYADFGFNEALSRDPSSLSYSVDLDGGYRLLAIDSCKYGESSGALTPAVLQWIRGQAQDAGRDGKHLVAMMHHALLRHYGGFGDLVLDRALDDDRIDNADAVWEELADLGIQIIFTGHMHANSITKDTSAKGNELYDIETNALTTYPCSWRTVTFGQEGVGVTTRTVGSVDPANLPAGYNAAQLALLESGFPRYAYGYIAASAQYMLKVNLLYPQNALNRFGIDAQSDLGKLLLAVLPDAYGCFCMPLYATPQTQGASIEEIAALGGYALPASGYAGFFEVLNVIIGNYTCGDADMPGDAPEVRLLLDCIKAVMVYALGRNADKITPESLKEFSALTGIRFTEAETQAGLASLLFRRNLVNRTVRSLALPFLEGVTKDAFAPADVNVGLPPYGEIQNRFGFFDRLLETLRAYFDKLMKMFSFFIDY